MKFVCERTIRGVTKVYVITLANGVDPGLGVKSICGIGNAYYAFNTLSGTVIGADFTGAPVVSSDTAQNNADIDAMLLDPPLDKIFFA